MPSLRAINIQLIDIPAFEGIYNVVKSRLSQVRYHHLGIARVLTLSKSVGVIALLTCSTQSCDFCKMSAGTETNILCVSIVFFGDFTIFEYIACI